MRPLLALLLLLAVAPARADLNTDGLPAGAAAVMGFDFAIFRATKFGGAIESLASLKAKDLEVSRKLRERVGIDTDHDIRDFVVAVYPGADGKVAEKSASGVVLIRGKFLPARIDRFGQENGVPSKAVGRHQAWKAAPFIEKLTGEQPKDSANDAYLVAHSENLVLLAGAEFLERALAAADRNERAPQLPAAIATKFAAARQGWFYLYADATKMEKAKEEAGIQDLALVLGENATDLQLAAAAGFVSPEKASVMRKQIKGLQAFAMIGLSNDDGKSPEEKENLGLLSELVEKIRIGGEGRQTTLDLEFPADRAAKAIGKVVEKARKSPAAPAAK